MKNKIGWCNLTWNPVWGCNNHCEYCYARGIAKRFAEFIAEYEIDEIYGGSIDGNSLISFYNEKKENIEDFIPTFLHSQFKKKFPKKPQRIFIGSMSEIYYWKPEWIERVIEKIMEYPQHIFQFLTKFPNIYTKWEFPRNCWLGVTITKRYDFDNGTYDFIFPNNSENNRNNIKYISFEPLLSEILDLEILKYIDWVIIGAETGNRKGKIIPKEEWIIEICNYCREEGIPIYLKDSIYKLYPDWPVTKEFPVEV